MSLRKTWVPARSRVSALTASSGLSKDEIDRAIREAESHVEDDLKKKELIEPKNQADSLAYSVEKNIKEFGDKAQTKIGKPWKGDGGLSRLPRKK